MMKKYFLKSLVVILLAVATLALVRCDDTDVEGTCAGCPDDSPWSVFGSDQCYSTISDCEAAESGDCVICN